MPRRAIPGETDLATTHPHLAAELVDPALATQLTSGSGRKVWWRCDLGHEWDAIVVSRARGTGCPVCAGNQVLPGFNDLATTHPDLAAELVDPTLATQLTSGSGQKVWWRCDLGHEWDAIVANRERRTGCPVCAGKAVLPGFNDLATTHPELAAELADPTLATEVTAGSQQKVVWRCSLGHDWQTVVTTRSRSRGAGCPVCAGKAVLPGFNDLATTHPELAAELADPTLATQLTSGSGRKVWWRCAARHGWEASVNTRTSGSGCPFCAGRKVLVGFNDLATVRPDLAAELADPSVATQVTAGTRRSVAWRCQLDHTYETRVSRRASGIGCPFCTGNQVLAGFNDLATTHPTLAAQLVDQSLAAQLTAGSQRRVEWQCSEGHRWMTNVANRALRDTGCPECAYYGFSPTRPGFLYLIRSKTLHALQFGITNVPSVRLTTHSHRSFDELLELWLFESGADAAECERKLVAWKKRKQLPHVRSGDGDGRYSGFSETFPASAVREPFSLARWAVPLGGKLVSLDEAEQYLGR